MRLPINIRIETENIQQFIPLLLIGDEQEDMIWKYLPRCTLYVASLGGEDIAVCAVTIEEDGYIEIKNIAVKESFRRQGVGKEMLQHMRERYPQQGIKVGTGEVPSTMNFYIKCGFTYHSRVTDFFTSNYDHEIIEDGIPLKDMVYFVIPHLRMR